MSEQKRAVFHSSLTKQDGWVVTADGETVSRHDNQKLAEMAARKAGRKAYEKGGLGQAVLHKRDGTIREERTYGKDPERTPANINAEIDRELEIAKARWGETFELKCLEGSRGDTIDDPTRAALLS